MSDINELIKKIKTKVEVNEEDFDTVTHELKEELYKDLPELSLLDTQIELVRINYNYVHLFLNPFQEVYIHITENTRPDYIKYVTNPSDELFMLVLIPAFHEVIKHKNLSENIQLYIMNELAPSWFVEFDKPSKQASELILKKDISFINQIDSKDINPDVFTELLTEIF
jgi:hypothetical protein